MTVIHESPWQPDHDCKPLSACFFYKAVRGQESVHCLIKDGLKEKVNSYFYIGEKEVINVDACEEECIKVSNIEVILKHISFPPLGNKMYHFCIPKEKKNVLTFWGCHWRRCCSWFWTYHWILSKTRSWSVYNSI